MSAVVIAGNTSGTVTLQAPDVSGSTTLNLPTISGGTLVTTNASGYALFGTGTTAYGSDYIQIANTGAANIAQFRFSNTASSASIKHYKSRGTTLGSFTAVQNGDTLSTYYSYGSDGTAWVTPVQFYTSVDGTVSTGIIPSKFTILTTNSAGTQADQFSVRANGDTQFNSGYGSVATAYGCRAWVNFNGTGTVAIRASGNVTSITDGGTGIYTVNFTTALPDANYETNAMTSDDSSAAAFCYLSGTTGSASTSSIIVRVVNTSGTPVDRTTVAVSIHR